MMKKLLFLSIMLFVGVNATFAQKAIITDSYLLSEKIGAEEYQIDAYVNFDVTGAKGKDITILILFYEANGNPLKDKNNRYYTRDGDVAMYRKITPSYDNSNYEDLKISMPSAELDLSYARKDLQYKIFILYNNNIINDGVHYNKFSYVNLKDRCTFDRCWGNGSYWLGGQQWRCPQCQGKGYNFTYGLFCLRESVTNSSNKPGTSTPSSGSGSSTSTPNKISSRQCYACKGTGTTIKTSYVTGGLSGTKTCGTCGASYPAGTTHVHVRCTSCDGKGYIKY